MTHGPFFAMTALTVAVSLGTSGQPGRAPVPREGADATVLRLLDDWAAAYVRHDRAAIERILGEEFVMSAGRPELQTRAEYLRKVENDQEPHAAITRDDERVRVYGDAAVVNHRLTRTTQGRSFAFRVTDVCVRRDGRWQLVNRHITELPQPK
jgi:hypothetical protein